MSNASDLKSEILSRVPADGGTVGNTKLQGLLREAGVEVSEGRMLVLKAPKELVDDFASEVQGLVDAMDQKPHAEKLDRWGWNKP